MSIARKLERLGDQEAALAFLCSLLARGGESLATVEAAHRAQATRLGGKTASVSAARALVGALAAKWRPGGVLAWLARREDDLVHAYLALDLDSELDGETRVALRRELLPAAYERFTRVDRLVAARDATPAPAWYDARA